jgi:hypothetical protein
VEWIELAQGSVTGFCEYSDETNFGFFKSSEFVDLMNNNQLLKEDCIMSMKLKLCWVL